MRRCRFHMCGDWYVNSQGLEKVGTVGWARTTDLRIHNPAL